MSSIPIKIFNTSIDKYSTLLGMINKVLYVKLYIKKVKEHLRTYQAQVDDFLRNIEPAEQNVF